MNQKFPYTWEEAINILRSDPHHQQLIFDAYLTSDVVDNCKRFYSSSEFKEVTKLIKKHISEPNELLDIPGGNGIATYAFVKAGFSVTTVDPDSSASVGRGAIKRVLEQSSLKANIVDAYGEELPFDDSSFDVIYVRQGLHHAADLKKMLVEYFRVLRPDGVLIACREHVVDDYNRSLSAFLESQVDHQLYGGENAFTLEDYRAGFTYAGFTLIDEITPYESPINLYPNTKDSLITKILETKQGRFLSKFLSAKLVVSIGMWRLKKAKLPGRLYTFIAKK